MVNNIAEAIEKVMVAAHSPSELNNMGMYSFEDGRFKPVSSHRLGFDSQQNQLEPSYYWLLDFVSNMGWKWEKLVDNFMASPGSGQFSEMNMRATKMQEEGMKILGGMNQVIKSVLNLVYDLKEFELRLAHYDDYNSSDPKLKEQGMLALKQIWLDNVDLKKGRGAIHQMSTMEMGFSTLREAFMMANSVKDLKKMNDDEKGGLINDQVMRILIPRISEFLKWVEYSEKEMRKRFSIEKNYLKSQVETIKLYSGWMKPYLIAAEKLRQKGFDNDAAMVNAFSTSMFQLELFAQKKSKLDPDIYSGYKSKRNYYSVLVIDFEFRGHVSQRVTQKGDYGFGMGGKIDMIFKSYALNDEEIAAAKKILSDEDVVGSLVFSHDIASEALKDLKEDLDYFLMSDDEKAKVKFDGVNKEKENQDINPFVALFGLWKKSSKKASDKNKEMVVNPGDIKRDNFLEKIMRGNAADSAAGSLYTAYDVYKKAHRMGSAPGEGFDTHEDDKTGYYGEGGSVGFFGIFKGREGH